MVILVESQQGMCPIEFYNTHYGITFIHFLNIARYFTENKLFAFKFGWKNYVLSLSLSKDKFLTTCFYPFENIGCSECVHYLTIALF